MFLFGLVLLMLWQRNAIKQETVNSRIFLQMAIVAITNTPQGQNLPPEIKNFLTENNVHCLQWKNGNNATNNSYGACPDTISLAPFLQNATKGISSTNYSGMIWNGFFFSRKYLFLAIPLSSQQHDITAIGLVRSLEKVSNPIQKTRPIFFAYLVINVLVFGVIGFTRLVHLVIRPIQHLAQLADSRTDQNDTAFFTSGQWGEFTQLSLSLNQLVARIDGDKQQLQSTVLSLKKANEELQNNRDEMIRTEKLVSIEIGRAHV